jgi:hypothetical protein
MKLYDKLKECDAVEDYKDYAELIWMKAIKINGVHVDNPNHEITENDKDITVGILSL